MAQFQEQTCRTNITFSDRAFNAMQCNAMQCCLMQCNAMQYNTMQCNTMQCNAMQTTICTEFNQIRRHFFSLKIQK
jgi:hypothetical protein